MSEYISIFDLFSVGIGPSSSHSVGPMRAAKRFVGDVEKIQNSEKVFKIQVRLYGSLALTGKGHRTDKALVLGLLGYTPESIDPDQAESIVDAVVETGVIGIGSYQKIEFQPQRDILFLRKEALQFHPNGMRFDVLDDANEIVLQKSYFSVGGGFVVEDSDQSIGTRDCRVPYGFQSGAELVQHAKQNECPISRVIWENEKCLNEGPEIRQRILKLWAIMQECVARGCRESGTLPGGLKVERRAAALFAKLNSQYETKHQDPLNVLDWVDLYALAVNEENAAGGRVVTAPTNGAAGIIPAVLHYYDRFCAASNEDGIVKFFLTAGAIGMLYKMNASISGAEVGCQGEVGVACSMAAGALTEVMGGNPDQVEQAAEIGMEHNLGLACDPIGGLVQVPCIERNAMGAVKAINASRIALRENGKNRVSLDKVIQTMRRTGDDMSSKYKETSQGGLAVNVTEC